MPSHPDRVRRNYVDVEIYGWRSIIDHEEHFMIRVSTCDIASCMTRKELSPMLIKKIIKEVYEN